jgi:hypothetical protein
MIHTYFLNFQLFKIDTTVNTNLTTRIHLNSTKLEASKQDKAKN